MSRLLILRNTLMEKRGWPIKAYVADHQDAPAFPQPYQKPDGVFSKRSIVFKGKTHPLGHPLESNPGVRKSNNKKLIDFSNLGAKVG